MASVSTHDPYVPGSWALEQIRIWQDERSQGFKQVTSLVERVGAAGVMAGERLHGVWWDTDKPPQDLGWWQRLVVPNSKSKTGAYRSAIGSSGKTIWHPRKTVMHQGVERNSPLYEEFHSIRIRDWWDLSVILGIRPMFWPAFGLMLMPELEVLGDYGENVVVWSPKDRFGYSPAPIDCTLIGRKELKKIYGQSWRDLKIPPVLEAYVGDDIRFRFENDHRDRPQGDPPEDG